MSIPTPPDEASEHVTLDEIRSFQAGNAAAIRDLITAQQENARSIERLSEAIDQLRSEQNRTSNDVSTLKG